MRSGGERSVDARLEGCGKPAVAAMTDDVLDAKAARDIASAIRTAIVNDKEFDDVGARDHRQADEERGYTTGNTDHGTRILHEPRDRQQDSSRSANRANCTCFQIPSRLLLEGGRCDTIDPVIVRIRPVHSTWTWRSLWSGPRG